MNLAARLRRWRRDIVLFVREGLALSLSAAQEALLRAIYALPPGDDRQVVIFRECTGRSAWPTRPFPEVAVAAGARSGKDSRLAGPIVVWEALLGGHERHVAKGERATIVLVAQDQRATKVAFTYIRDYLTGSSLLSGSVAEVLASEIRLTNGISIVCFPCTLRSLRGWSIPVAVMDELAFFRLEGTADSDAEIQTSIRRGMIAFPTSRLVKVSTPYMRSGVLYEDFTRAWAQPDPDLLVWRASSTLMNPTLRLERLEAERRKDPRRFEREYGAEFTDEVAAFLPREWIETAVVPGLYRVPPQPGVRYVAAVDPSGGGPDAFTLAIVHAEPRGVVLDAMLGFERLGTNLEGAVKEITQTLRAYGVREVLGDRYAGQWVRAAFQTEGITYRDAPEKSTAYLELEPLLAQGRLSLLDHPQLVRELGLLERRARPGGRTLIDHPRGAHDDYANALALAVAAATSVSAVPRPAAASVATPFSRSVGAGLTADGSPVRRGGSGLPPAGRWYIVT